MVTKKRNTVQLEGLGSMARRLRTQGGNIQQNRMIDSKLWSLKHALKASYQGAKIKPVDERIKPHMALINPNKLKPDYDDKILSVEYQYGYKAGDVFDWCNTGTKWLIYLQDLTELAYFKGQIRRCCYSVEFLDDEGNKHKIYAAVRGPVETRIGSFTKYGDNVDEPNYSLDMLMPKNEYTLKYFRRYSKFYLQGLDPGDKPICWRVNAADSISMPGVLEIIAEEYYINDMYDDVEAGIANGLIVTPIEPTKSLIKGPDTIKPMQEVEYSFVGNKIGVWTVLDNAPVEIRENGRKAIIIWKPKYSGSFTLQCGNVTRTIIVESLL